MTDDRIVLPLSKVRGSAAVLCRRGCRRVPALGHEPECLVPLVEARDALLTSDKQRRYTQGLDPDCVIGGAKHLACTGCTCDCHRHSRRGS